MSFGVGESAGFVVPSGEGEPIELRSWSMRVAVPARATGGAFTVIHGTMAPRPAGPPTHIHDGHDEAFVVVSGHMRFQPHDRVIDAGAGETIFAPRGLAHGFSDVGDDPARYVAFIAPSGYEAYFHEVAKHLSATGEMPDHQLTAQLMAKYATHLA